MVRKGVGLDPVVPTRVLAEQHVETRLLARHAVLADGLARLCHLLLRKGVCSGVAFVGDVFRKTPDTTRSIVG